MHQHASLHFENSKNEIYGTNTKIFSCCCSSYSYFVAHYLIKYKMVSRKKLHSQFMYCDDSQTVPKTYTAIYL